MKRFACLLLTLMLALLPLAARADVIWAVEQTQDRLVCEFKISDTGIGMSEDFVKNKLFVPFVQEGTSPRTKYMGTGLADISNPEVFYNEHAMVVGNLLHRGDPAIQKEVDNPLKSNQIFYAGLQEPTNNEKKLIEQAGIKYKVQDGNQIDSERVIDWIKENNFEHIYIHLDVDVMNPDSKNFYATYFNNPDLGEIPDNAAVGKMSRKSIWQFISNFSKEYNLVGLTLAEYLPWSAKEMLDLMNNTNIF